MSALALISQLDKLELAFGDGLTWTKNHHANCLAAAAARVEGYYGRETTPLQAELCKSLGKPANYGWIMDWNDHPTTTFTDVKKLIATTRDRLRAEVH